MARSGPTPGSDDQLAKEEAQNPQEACPSRTDDSGIWSKCKAWYIFIAHIMACLILALVLIFFVDGRQFNAGSPPQAFTSSLYQVHVSGLISLANTALRPIISVCRGLLVWRSIYILLDKRGITINELNRLATWNLPTLSAAASNARKTWIYWPLVVLLLWPAQYASPLVQSSVAWIPSVRLSNALNLTVYSIADGLDWRPLIYPNENTAML